MSNQQIKVIYKNETKKFKKPSDYLALHQQTVKAFGNSLPKNFKFFYQDPEGDLISISCQEDLEEAYSSMTTLRLIVEASIQEARNLMEPDFSMRSSSLNMPLQTSQHHSNNPLSQAQYFDHDDPSAILRKPSMNSHFDFEDIGGKNEEQKSTNVVVDSRNQSVGVGSSPFDYIGAEAATDVNNLVNLQNFGTNTNWIQTDEKQLNAVVDTKDCGSQIQKDVREAFCDGSIQTESKGSQFKTEAVS